MVRLLCDGVFLDAPQNIKLTTKKTNPLFAFDNLEVERSATFTLPATATNNRVFAMANNPAADGYKARVFLPVQIVEGSAVSDGFLYVVSATRDAYECCALIGQLSGLKRVKNAGKIRDFLVVDDVCTLSTTYTPASTTSFLYEQVNYRQATGHAVVPSYPLKTLFERCAAALSVRATYPEAIRYARYIPDHAHLLEETPVKFRSVVVDPSQPLADDPTTPYNACSVEISSGAAVFGTSEEITATYINRLTRFYNIQHHVCAQNIEVTFPVDFPEKLHVGRFDYAGYRPAEWFGGYSFEKTYDGTRRRVITTRTGSPLAGRSVEIPAGTPFVFVNEDDYIVTYISGSRYDFGFHFGINAEGMTYEHSVVVKGKDDEAHTGNIIRLQDNLPDCTFIELCQTIAALTGTALNYTEAGGIVFDPVNAETWRREDLTGRVINTGKITRTFGDFAQRNYVLFDSDEIVTQDARIIRNYSLHNETLEEEKDLQKIPFSEGGETMEGGVPVLYIDNQYKEATKYTLATGTAADENPAPVLRRVSIPEIPALSSLAADSTAYTITANISRLEFDRITPKTLLFYGGVLHVWTSATFSDGKASFECSKIMLAEVVPPYIPEEYQQVNYIQNNGTIQNTRTDAWQPAAGATLAYINTGFIPTIYTDFSVRMSYISGNIYAGCAGNNGYYALRPIMDATQQAAGKMQIQYGGERNVSTIDAGIDYTQPHEIRIANGLQTIDGEVVGTASATNIRAQGGGAPLPLGIGVALFGWLSTYTGSGRIWGAAIREGGELVREFVPCYRKADNVAGMYERVEGLFYTSDSPAPFTFGQPV